MNKILVVATDIEEEFAKQNFSLPIIKTGVGYGNVIEKLKDLDKQTKIMYFCFYGYYKFSFETMFDTDGKPMIYEGEL